MDKKYLQGKADLTSPEVYKHYIYIGQDEDEFEVRKLEHHLDYIIEDCSSHQVWGCKVEVREKDYLVTFLSYSQDIEYDEADWNINYTDYELLEGDEN